MNEQLKKQIMNQFVLNMNKPTGLSPSELREKLLKLKNQIINGSQTKLLIFKVYLEKKVLKN